ncbi:MAG: PPC domain-containing DNA-binding protein [Candidatus Saccharibacteria bacterium]|nr:PPC domain-containing DNA-binding protein [Candidatus Saccharibacteria bacterium]
MTYKFDGYNWLVKLDKGDLLVENLTKLVKQENIRGAWVSGLGAALWAELGYYDLDAQEYQWQKFDQLLEITSLQGNVAWSSDEPVLHIHGSFSDKNLQAIGGHVKEVAVGGTCEVFLHRWFGEAGLSRQKDDSTGLYLLSM